MLSKMVQRLLMAAVATAFVAAMALPADAGPATTEKVTDFYTNALDADGNFKLVFCSHAQQVVKNGKVTETYHCEFVPDEFWGDPVLPTTAMRWDYESSDGLQDATIPGLEGPYRWYSDIEAILSQDDCYWYTNDWSMVITPSGNVNVKVVYNPPLVEGDCPSE